MPTLNSHMREPTQLELVLRYAVELELEVDRLRRRDQFLQQETRDHIRSKQACEKNELEAATLRLNKVSKAYAEFSELLRDVNEPPGYHPAFDQVIAIAVGPLAEQVFRWQQRLCSVSNATLRLDLEPDHIEWFPARLRHILDNLISNALRYCDHEKGEVRVGICLRSIRSGYELQVTDNGVGISQDRTTGLLDILHRATPSRAAKLGVGLSVVQVMVEQCCGKVMVTSGEGEGTNVTVVLPKFDIHDHMG